MGTAQSILTPSDRVSARRKGITSDCNPIICHLARTPYYKHRQDMSRRNGPASIRLPGACVVPMETVLMCFPETICLKRSVSLLVLEGGRVSTNSSRDIDIWEYTLYWHLVFHSLIFGLPALWFTIVTLFSPTSSLSLRVRSKKRDLDAQSVEMITIQPSKEQRVERPVLAGSRPEEKPSRNGVVGITSTGETIQLSSVQTNMTDFPSDSGEDELLSRTEASSRASTPPSANQNGARPRKSAPLYLAFLPFIFLALWGMASALIMSTIIGFVLAAVYNTTGFEMAT